MTTSINRLRFCLRSLFLVTLLLFQEPKMAISATIPGSWTQVGLNINGRYTNDQLGYDVALSADGTVVAAVALNAPPAGYVRVLRYISSASTWIPMGSDITGPTYFRKDYGYSLALSADGQTIAIGAPNICEYGDSVNCSGAVFVYRFDGSDWDHIGTIYGEQTSENFGSSVTLSNDGNTIMAASPLLDNNANVTDIGAVKVYHFDGLVWSQVGSYIVGDEADNLVAGKFHSRTISSSSDASKIAVGFIGGNDTQTGYVRVFQFIQGEWNQVGPDIDGDTSMDAYGFTTALSADGLTVAVGTPHMDYSAQDQGQVRVFRFTGTAWVQLGSSIFGEEPWDYLGWNIRLSSDGNTLVINSEINAPCYNYWCTYPGNDLSNDHTRITVYHFSGTDWDLVGSVIDTDQVANNVGSVSISADGSTVAIGTVHSNTASGSNSGLLRVIRFVPDCANIEQPENLFVMTTNTLRGKFDVELSKCRWLAKQKLTSRKRICKKSIVKDGLFGDYGAASVVCPISCRTYPFWFLCP